MLEHLEKRKIKVAFAVFLVGSIVGLFFGLLPAFYVTAGLIAGFTVIALAQYCISLLKGLMFPLETSPRVQPHAQTELINQLEQKEAQIREWRQKDKNNSALIGNLKNKNENLEATNKQQIQHIKELEQKLAAQEINFKKSQEELVTQEQSRQKLEQQGTALETEKSKNEILSAELSQKTKAEAEQQEIIKSLEQRLFNLQKQREEEAEKHRESSHTIKEQNEKLEKAVQEKLEHVRKLTDENEALRVANQTLQQEVQQQQEKISTQEQSRQELLQQLKQQGAALETEVQRNTTLNAKLSQQTKAEAEQQEIIKSLEQQLLNLQKQRQEEVKKHSELSRTIEIQNRGFEQKAKEALEHARELTDENKALKVTNQTLQQEVQRQQEEISTQKQSCQKLLQQLEQQGTALQVEAQRNTTLSAELSQQTEAGTEQQKTIKSLEQQLLVLKEKIQEETEKHNKLSRTIEIQNREFEQKKQEILERARELTAKNKLLKNNLQIFKQKAQQLKQENIALQAEKLKNETLNTEVKQRTDAVMEKQKIIDSLQQELSISQEQVQLTKRILLHKVRTILGPNNLTFAQSIRAYLDSAEPEEFQLIILAEFFKTILPDELITIINTLDIDGYNLLHYAAKLGLTDVFKALLKWGGNPRILSRDGLETPAMTLVKHYPNLFKNLLTPPIDIATAQQNAWGETVFHILAQHYTKLDSDFSKILSRYIEKAGEKTVLRDASGLTAQQLLSFYKRATSDSNAQKCLDLRRELLLQADDYRPSLDRIPPNHPHAQNITVIRKLARDEYLAHVLPYSKDLLGTWNGRNNHSATPEVLSIVCVPNLEGRLIDYRVYPLHTNDLYEGLYSITQDGQSYRRKACVPYLLIPINTDDRKKGEGVFVLFRGTKSTASVFADIEFHGPGSSTFHANINGILTQIDEILAHEYQDQPLPVIETLGHSLGGAMAQYFTHTLMALQLLQGVATLRKEQPDSKLLRDLEEFEKTILTFFDKIPCMQNPIRSFKKLQLSTNKQPNEQPILQLHLTTFNSPGIGYHYLETYQQIVARLRALKLPPATISLVKVHGDLIQQAGIGHLYEQDSMCVLAKISLEAPRITYTQHTSKNFEGNTILKTLPGLTLRMGNTKNNLKTIQADCGYSSIPVNILMMSQSGVAWLVHQVGKILPNRAPAARLTIILPSSQSHEEEDEYINLIFDGQEIHCFPVIVGAAKQREIMDDHSDVLSKRYTPTYEKLRLMDSATDRTAAYSKSTSTSSQSVTLLQDCAIKARLGEMLQQ